MAVHQHAGIIEWIEIVSEESLDNDVARGQLVGVLDFD